MKPSTIVFDVNETLSDMSPMGQRFVEVGAPAHLAKLWFASLLRDGFALTAAGDNGTFAGIGAEALRGMFTGLELNRDLESAVKHVMAGLSALGLHPDVVAGVKALHTAGYRLATLTNGTAQVAEKLFTDAGIRNSFDLLLSVEDAPSWKPGKASYEYAAAACGTTPEQILLVAVHPWDIHGAVRRRGAWGWTVVQRDDTSVAVQGFIGGVSLTTTPTALIGAQESRSSYWHSGFVPPAAAGVASSCRGGADPHEVAPSQDWA